MSYSLTRDILNGKRLEALCVPEEIAEVRAVGHERITLKRTFNMTMNGVTFRFWRVIGPKGQRSLNSDLSIEGLKEWGII
jgi:hypothetical protein